MESVTPRRKPERRCWWAVFGFPWVLLVDAAPLSKPLFAPSPRGAVHTLDIDATDDLIHGHQEKNFFHGYYDHHCFLPV
jgi:hypothetical protein